MQGWLNKQTLYNFGDLFFLQAFPTMSNERKPNRSLLFVAYCETQFKSACAFCLKIHNMKHNYTDMREYKSSITNERNESVHFAPLALSNSTMRACPFDCAEDNGVRPSFIFALTLAPFLSSTDATRIWPFSNSINNGTTKQQKMQLISHV